MAPVFDRAGPDDVGSLMRLYRQVYGDTYTLPLGTDPEVIASTLRSDRNIWLVARESTGDRLVASILATVDPTARLGKLQGLAVRPDQRGSGLAHHAVGRLSDLLLAEDLADSVYGTARTTTTAPQRICLRNGFHALGILPNLRRTRIPETMALVARFRDGVLSRRHPVPAVPAALRRLVDATDVTVGFPVRPRILPEPVPRRTAKPDGTELEVIEASRFVASRFAETVTDPVRRFYPFHTPNMLLSATDSQYEVYAHLNRLDGYCALIGAAPDLTAVADNIDEITVRLNQVGADYVETLVPLHAFDELVVLLGHGFLPVALYPAMRRDGDAFHDYVVLARTRQQLDFRGLAIDMAFQPFVEQYLDLWTHQYLNTCGVFR